jgi:uncharacterized protein (TIGR02679 family)
VPANPPAWWSAQTLRHFWDALAERLERNGLQPSGRLSAGPLDRHERHALTDLLGRPVTTDRTAVDLSALDDRLRSRSGVGLVEAVEQVRGAPLVDRPAVRQLQSRRRDAPVLAVGRWLDDHPDVEWPWLEPWMQDLRRDGILARDPDPVKLVVLALDVLWDRRAFLHEKGHDGGGSRAVPEQPVARTELAARTAHDAHALDDDRRLSSVVLRALVARTGSDLPTGGSASARRALWETAGVLSDTVSSTCLTLQLRPDPSWPAGERMGAYADAGVPLHVTWWDLRSGLTPAREQDVLVCENPRVLEAVAERSLPGTAVICTSGRPALVVTELLARVRDSESDIRYHGDFDWPGIAMANELVLRFGARPWRMSADDYLAEPASLPLSPAPVEPLWDPELGAAMRHRGLAVHEEAVLAELLGALEKR